LSLKPYVAERPTVTRTQITADICNKLALSKFHVSPTHIQNIQPLKTTDTGNKSVYFAACSCEDYGYELTLFPALATPEYPIYSGDKIPDGNGDNLAVVLSYNPQ